MPLEGLCIRIIPIRRTERDKGWRIVLMSYLSQKDRQSLRKLILKIKKSFFITVSIKGMRTGFNLVPEKGKTGSRVALILLRDT